MSTEGLCQICRAEPADRRCDRCGTLVCADHFRAGAGVCLECAAELGLGEGGEGQVEDHPDVDRYEF